MTVGPGLLKYMQQQKEEGRLGHILRLSFVLNVGRNGDGSSLISSSKKSGYHWTLAMNMIDVDCLYLPSFFFLLSPFSPSLPGRAASGIVKDFLGWGGWYLGQGWVMREIEEGQGR